MTSAEPHDLSNLTIVIPAYNEEETLPSVLDELSEFCKQTQVQVIIVNDGSKDQTAQILLNAAIPNLNAVHHKVNRGYGGALKSGLAAVTTAYAITIDADGQHILDDVVNMYHKAIQRDADMIVGSRKGHKNASAFRALGKFIIRSLAKVMMNVPIHDLNSGMKIYHTKTVQNYLHLTPNTMAFSDIITLIFLNNRHLVLEEPISIKERAGGTSTIGLEAAYNTIMEIINIVVMFHPMKIFLPVSIFAFGFGTIWTLYFIIAKRTMTTGGSFFMMSGIFIFLLGLITEQLSQLRKNGPGK